MNFAHPRILFFIWAAAPLILLFVWGMVRRKRLLEGYAEGDGLSRIAGTASAGRRYARAVLVVAAFILMVVALAGPRYGYHWEKVERKGVDLIVALDCSASMLAEDVKPSRLVRAKREIVDLLGMLTGDRVGLVAFAGNAFLQCPLTLDTKAFKIFLDALSPDFLPKGGTNLGAAVNTAVSAFKKSADADKAIILITDGESTTGPDPVSAARVASEKDIRIFSIGVGGGEGAPVPGEQGHFKKDEAGNIVLSRLDEKTLKEMASLTGGAYVRSVAGDMDLDTIYHEQIKQTMEETTLKSGKKRVWENRFQWFLVLSFLCLAAEMLVPVRKALPVIAAAVLAVSLAAPARADSLYESVKQGKSAYQDGQYEKALKHFIDAQLKDPENPFLYYNIGNAYYKNQEFVEAATQYKSALEQAGEKGNESLKKDILYNLGNTSFKQGDFKGAIEYYEKVLKIDENDRQAEDNLELAQKALKRQKERQQKQKQRQKQQRQDRQDKQKKQEKEASGDRQKQQDSAGKDNGRKRAEQPAPGDTGGDRKEQKKARQPETGQKPQAGEKQTQQQKKKSPAQAGRARPPADSEKSKSAVGSDKLNRLEDKPGGAMIPVYRGERVEKDW